MAKENNRISNPDIDELWEAVLENKARIDEMPCRETIKKIAEDLNRQNQKHRENTGKMLQAFSDDIKQFRTLMSTIDKRTVEFSRQAQENHAKAYDIVKEHEARIIMVKKAMDDLMTQWNSVLETLGYTLEFQPARYQVTKKE